MPPRKKAAAAAAAAPDAADHEGGDDTRSARSKRRQGAADTEAVTTEAGGHGGKRARGQDAGSTEIQAAAGQSCLPIFDTEVQQEQQEEAGIVQQLAQAAGGGQELVAAGVMDTEGVDGAQPVTADGGDGGEGAAGDVGQAAAGGEDFQAADPQRLALEGMRKADMQNMTYARRQNHVVTIGFTLDLPEELADLDLGDRTGIIEVPVTGDVQMLKRLFMYQAHNKLLPSLQSLYTEADELMVEHKEDGSPMPLAHYGIAEGSKIKLKIEIPDELPDLPLIDEALASAPYNTSASAAGRTPSRKTRWTTEQIEALVEGVEKYGLSAWRTIVMDPRLQGKNNMQCKDKFRNLCLTIIQGRPERGLTLPWQLKDRVRVLIEQENAKERAQLANSQLDPNQQLGVLPTLTLNLPASNLTTGLAGSLAAAGVAAGQLPGGFLPSAVPGTLPMTLPASMAVPTSVTDMA
eukprot:jgi/Chrzof1/2944/Cz12g05110.t1